MKRGEKIFIKYQGKVINAEWIGNDPQDLKKCYVKIGQDHLFYYDGMENDPGSEIISLEKINIIME